MYLCITYLALSLYAVDHFRISVVFMKKATKLYVPIVRNNTGGTHQAQQSVSNGFGWLFSSGKRLRTAKGKYPRTWLMVKGHLMEDMRASSNSVLFTGGISSKEIIFVWNLVFLGASVRNL